MVTAEYLAVLKLLEARARDLDDIHGILLRQGENFQGDFALSLAYELGQAVDDDLASRLAVLRR